MSYSPSPNPLDTCTYVSWVTVGSLRSYLFQPVVTRSASSGDGVDFKLRMELQNGRVWVNDNEGEEVGEGVEEGLRRLGLDDDDSEVGRGGAITMGHHLSTWLHNRGGVIPAHYNVMVMVESVEGSPEGGGGVKGEVPGGKGGVWGEGKGGGRGDVRVLVLVRLRREWDGGE